MKDDIRRATCCIVRRNGEYLVGKVLYSQDLRWSGSPYDAWQTRDAETAKNVAHMLGGDLWLFNPPTGQLREANITTQSRRIAK